MRQFSFRISLPLLGRELIELSNRRRTYVLRSLCALAAGGILAAFLLVVRPAIKLIGQGDNIIEWTSYALIAVIVVVLPASCANNILREKEQGTLVLLLLTPLSPKQLIRQKFWSSVVMMISLLLTFLPVFALSYAYGGVSEEQIVRTSLGLLLLVFLVAAVAIAVSSRCQGLVTSLILIYGILFFQTGISGYIVDTVNSTVSSYGQRPGFSSLLAWTTPIPLLMDDLSYSDKPVLHWLLLILPCLLSVWGYLALGARFLRRTPPQPGPSRLLSWLKAIDRGFESIDARWGRYYQRELPGDKGVFWRETHRRSFTSWRYLVRLLFIPVTVTVLLSFVAPLVCYHVVLIGALVLLVLSNASTFERDRRDQGLEVILSTPLSARGFVRQKALAQFRLYGVVVVWLMLIIIMDRVSSTSIGMDSADRAATWPARVAIELPVAILIPGIVSWTIFFLATRFRNRLLVLVAGFAVVLAWLAVAPLCLFTLEASPRSAWFVSPISMTLDIDYLTATGDAITSFLLVRIACFYAVVYALIMYLCVGRSPAVYEHMLASRPQ